MKTFPKLIVLDADNTLYDWVGFFAVGWRDTLSVLHQRSGASYEALSLELRRIFRTRGTVEYSYALLDGSLCEITGLRTSALRELRRRQDAVQRSKLRPYPGVVEGLALFESAGIPVICLSDANRTDLIDRLVHTDLLRYFKAVYCRPEYPLPPDIRRLRRNDWEAAGAGSAEVRTLGTNQRKPDPEIISSLCEDFQVEPSDVVLLGDNLLKDIILARASGVFDCWARYGFDNVSKHNLEVLLQLTDWPPEAVDAFLEAKPETTGVYPSATFDSFTGFVSWVFNDWRFAAPRPEYAPSPRAVQASFDELLQTSPPFDTLLPT